MGFALLYPSYEVLAGGLAIDRLPASASPLLTIWAGRPHYPFDDGSAGA